MWDCKPCRLFQHKLKGKTDISKDGPLFLFKWSLEERSLDFIKCDGDLNVTLWISTRSVNTYNGSVFSSEYFMRAFR